MNEWERFDRAPIKQHADKPHLLFHGAQSTVNSSGVTTNFGPPGRFFLCYVPPRFWFFFISPAIAKWQQFCMLKYCTTVLTTAKSCDLILLCYPAVCHFENCKEIGIRQFVGFTLFYSLLCKTNAQCENCIKYNWGEWGSDSRWLHLRPPPPKKNSSRSGAC
jgi:hypothetical protein